MLRKKALDYFEMLTSEEDLILYIGKLICAEKASPGPNELLFVDEGVDYFSIATGLAITNTRKVYVVLEDNYLLRHFNSFIQAITSNSRNLYFLVFNSNRYTNTISQANIFNTIRSIKGVLVATGAMVHNYDRYFKNKQEVKKFKKDYKNLLGPAIGTLSIDDSKPVEVCEPSVSLEEFVVVSTMNEVQEQKVDIPSLNLDEIMKGKN